MNNKRILEHVTQYMEICLKRKAIEEDSFIKTLKILCHFFLIPSYAGYLCVIHNLCWIALKLSPKGKERTFTRMRICEYICLFCSNLNESFNVMLSKSPGSDPKTPQKTKSENQKTTNQTNKNPPKKICWEQHPQC